MVQQIDFEILKNETHMSLEEILKSFQNQLIVLEKIENLTEISLNATLINFEFQKIDKILITIYDAQETISYSISQIEQQIKIEKQNLKNDN